jgi:hypothetical protein
MTLRASRKIMLIGEKEVSGETHKTINSIRKESEERSAGNELLAFCLGPKNIYNPNK